MKKKELEENKKSIGSNFNSSLHDHDNQVGGYGGKDEMGNLKKALIARALSINSAANSFGHGDDSFSVRTPSFL
jgi:hypothetical protein